MAVRRKVFQDMVVRAMVGERSGLLAALCCRCQWGAVGGAAASTWPGEGAITLTTCSSPRGPSDPQYQVEISLRTLQGRRAGPSGTMPPNLSVSEGSKEVRGKGGGGWSMGENGSLGGGKK